MHSITQFIRVNWDGSVLNHKTTVLKTNFLLQKHIKQMFPFDTSFVLPLLFKTHLRKTHFSPITEAFFNNAVLLHGHWYVLCCKNEPRAQQWCCTSLWRRCPPILAKARQNGRGVWLYKQPLRQRILRFLLLQQRWLLFADLRDSKPFHPLISLPSYWRLDRSSG